MEIACGHYGNLVDEVRILTILFIYKKKQKTRDDVI